MGGLALLCAICDLSSRQDHLFIALCAPDGAGVTSPHRYFARLAIPSSSVQHQSSRTQNSAGVIVSLKSRPTQQKRLARVLSKTLKDLEAKAETDPNDPAFIQLKSHLVQRIIQLETDSTRARAVIHLVEEPVEEPAVAADGEAVISTDDDTAIA